MPAVLTALDRGQICRSKAWVFADLCTGLSAEQTDVVCARLLPRADGLTTGELAARIKKLAIALDPEWAARRYTTATRERNVVGYLNEDGTATVTGSGLPVDEAAAACARVENLARAAKQAGHPARLSALRADIYLGLLDGRWQLRNRDDIIADLLTRETGREDPGDNAADSGAAGGSVAAVANEGAAGDDSVLVDSNEVVASGLAEDAVAVGASGSSNPAGSARVGVELRVGLTTLLGWDRHPAEIAGWGPVTAEIARRVVLAQRSAEWRYAITDADGQLVHAGITRRRPRRAANGSEPPPCRGGIVELHIPARLLSRLTADSDAPSEWAPVIADIAAQNTRRGPIAQDAAARFAGAALRRHVQIRDRFCTFIGCRCPARHADLDHTVDHAHGGATTEANSGPTCRHDHLLKHLGGWGLHQPSPGHFVWTSPLGREYHTQPPPITTDLPEPRPRPHYPDDVPAATVDDDSPIMQRPPPTPDPPSSAEAAKLDEPPPF